jgi:GNAT superfamily N-acetyltransferase
MSFENNIQRKLVQDSEKLPVVQFTYNSSDGEASTYIDPRYNRLHIDSINVNYRLRNQGIGSAILRAIKNFAHETNIDVVTATIVSRESLDSMTSVFGEESVRVRKTGDYGFIQKGERRNAIDPASASLRYITKDDS